MTEADLPPAFKTLDSNLFEKWLNAREPEEIVGRENITEELDFNALHEQYQQQGFVKVDRVLARSFAGKLKRLREYLYSHNVTKEDQSWTEYNFPSGERIPVWLFDHPPFTEIIQQIVDEDPEAFARRYAWINYYEPGVHIPDHTDGEGQFQILAGLQSPDVPDPQGMLEIGDQRYRLEPGDFLFFKATDVRHRTYPVEDDDTPRMTLTVRYCE